MQTEINNGSFRGRPFDPEAVQGISGFYREPGVPSPNRMVIEGFRATPDVVKIWRERGMLREYRDSLTFFKKVHDLREGNQPVSPVAKTRMAVATG